MDTILKDLNVTIIWVNDPLKGYEKLKDRIEKTLSVEVKRSTNPLENIYRENSIIPQSNWGALTDEEFNKLITIKPYPYSQQIGVIDIPEVHSRELIKVGVGRGLDLPQYLLDPGKYTYLKNLLSPLINYARQFSLKSESERIFPVGFSKAGLVTLTQKYPEKCYIGMHIDSWDYTPYPEKRSLTRNRICINLGNEDRFFLFCPVPVNKIYKYLGVNLLKGATVKDFFYRYPFCPIYRLRLSPFQAYIAPTENIIHDGSSLEQKYFDAHLTILGYFRTVKKEES